MPARVLNRRAILLLPLVLAACGNSPQAYPTLRYDYLPPIQLNVATIEVRQDFVPSGVAPDISPLDPAQPVDALRQMAVDRLKSFGPAGRAVFVIQNASMIQDGDTISGNFAVRLDIFTSANNRVGYAEARVSRSHSGHVDDLQQLLYDMTKQLMDEMNVQFEYQVIHSLHDWVATGPAVPAAVQQQPLAAPGAVPPPTGLNPSAPSPGGLHPTGPSPAGPNLTGPSTTVPNPIPLAPTPLAPPVPRQP